MSTLASVYGYGLLSARAAAAVAGRFYYATDTSLMYRDNGSTWDTLAVGAGSMATDTIWAAKGDAVFGTGSHTSAKISAGSNGQVPVWDSSQTAGVKAAYPPAYQFDYAEFTSTVNVTATTEGAADAIVTGNSVAYDGSTAVWVEAMLPRVHPRGSSAQDYIVLCLFDGSTSLGQFLFETPAANDLRSPVIIRRKVTPSNASHTYSAKAFVNAGTGNVEAGAGGSGAVMPGYIRVVKV